MKVSILDQRHPDYAAEELADHAALYEGGPAFHARARTFIPMNAQEPGPLYADRLARVTYENLGGPLVDMIAAWLFSKPPEIEGFANTEWLDDVDGQGRDWADWWRQAFAEDALCGRRAWCWVNLPARGDAAPASRADEERMGLTRPFLVRLTAGSVINWKDDERGGLLWAMVKQECIEQADAFSPQARKTMWTYIDGAVIRRWVLDHPATGGTSAALPPAPGTSDLSSLVPMLSASSDKEATELPVIAHRIGAVPVIRMTLPPGLYAMRKLRDPLVALTRTANTHDWSLHVAGHALMTITTRDAATQPTLGPGYYLSLARDADGADEVGFAEPGGASNEARAARIADLRDAVHRVVQQMAASMSSEDSSTARSAASKMADWAGLEVMLSAYAAIVRTAMEQALDLVAKITGAPDPTVGGLAGWQAEDLADLVASFSMAAPSVKSPTFRKAMAKRLAVAFLPDASPQQRIEIGKEIDTADYDDPPVYAPALPPEV